MNNLKEESSRTVKKSKLKKEQLKQGVFLLGFPFADVFKLLVKRRVVSKPNSTQRSLKLRLNVIDLHKDFKNKKKPSIERNPI